ncbi:MAG: deoxyribodipyrimidine photo-lyase [Pseudomonadota bacterium]
MARNPNTPPLHLVWFKRDLRVADHRALARAAEAGPVLPLFVVEPDLWAEPDLSARQWAFAAECLAELREDLAVLGQPLVIRTGRVTEILGNLRASHPVAALWSHEETGNAWTFARDREVADWCRAEGLPWHEVPMHGVVRRIPTRNGWAKRWDTLMGEPVSPAPALAPLDIDPGEIPNAADLSLVPDPCPQRQPGGRRHGLERLESFLHHRGQPYRKAMSSPLEGAEACSRLSPHLAWGTLSMREAAQATWDRQRALKAMPQNAGVKTWRGAMNSFSGRLHWHCHFMQKLEDAPEIEHRNLHRAYDGIRPSAPDRERLEAWARGETGLPFVDACMRSLAATGWLNFRMRAMVMAVASYHLWLDWRASGLHLARQFTDYEPGIHWPQTQMQSGTTGINTVRIYNPVKQGHDQDPTGAFTRAWVPELAEIDDKHLQEPWKAENAAEILGRSYPHRIVDHLEAARAARDKIWAVRRGGAFRSEAGAIQDRHGSRKSGIPNRGRRASKPSNQLDLPLDAP